MAVDASQVETPAAPDTASASPAALPTEPTGDGAAVESQDGGDSELTAPTPESDDDSAEAGDETEAVTNEDGTPRPSRSERQRQKWLADLLNDPAKAKETLGPAIQPFIEEALSAKERQAQAEAEQQRIQAATEHAYQARIATFSEHLGTPDAAGTPGTMAQLQQEIDAGNRQIRLELTNPQGIDLDAVTAKVAAADAKLTRLRENNQLAVDLQDFIWQQIDQGGFARVGEIPEMAASPDVVTRFHGQRDVHAAHLLLAETVRAATAKAKDAQIAQLTEQHATALKAIEADRNAWRVRAGGSEASTAHGGQASTGLPDLTPERYAGLSFEDRQKLRATPEGRAQIDQMSRRQSGAA